MLIGGLQKLSLIDYPGKLAAIVFTQGCNFQCPYCHNPELVKRGRVKEGLISEKELFDFLKSRVRKLDAVVINGGEPTIQRDLPEFIKKIKTLNFLVGLYTNGAKPEMLKRLIKKKLIDYFSMDVKSQLTPKKYQLATAVKVNLDKIKESINLIMKSGVNYDFKTTVVQGLVTLKDVEALAKDIKKAKGFVIQQLVNSRKILDNKYKDTKPYPAEELERLRSKFKGFFERCEVRN